MLFHSATTTRYFLPFYYTLLCSAEVSAFVHHRRSATALPTTTTCRFVATDPTESKTDPEMSTSDIVLDNELRAKAAIREKLDNGWNPEGVINGVPDKEWCPPGEP